MSNVFTNWLETANHTQTWWWYNMSPYTLCTNFAGNCLHPQLECSWYWCHGVLLILHVVKGSGFRHPGTPHMPGFVGACQREKKQLSIEILLYYFFALEDISCLDGRHSDCIFALEECQLAWIFLNINQNYANKHAFGNVLQIEEGKLSMITVGDRDEHTHAHSHDVQGIVACVLHMLFHTACDRKQVLTGSPRDLGVERTATFTLLFSDVEAV